MLAVCLSPAWGEPQPDHNIVVFDLEGQRLVRPVVVAEGPEYENQPSFDSSGAVLFTRMEGERTDIWRWTARTGAKRLVRSPESEYSPTLIPGGGGAISTVRVEKDETQRLWRYAPVTGFKLIFETIKPVGYHAWCGDHVALFVLGEPHELRAARRGREESRLVDVGIGRCLQRVPGRQAVGYTIEEGPGHRLKTYDFASGKSAALRHLPKGSQDFVWVDAKTVITSDGSKILRGGAAGGAWETLTMPLKLKGISRLALSPDGKKLAVVYSGPGPR